ncbi:MAG: hypothetical protein DCC51_07525 [Anaerolineae bacterium]|nr:MAG: hypothetical protein DCC51_07525 [Anaerolineae bacterium]
MAKEITPAVRNRLIGIIFIVSSLAAAAQVAYFTLMPIIAADLSGSTSAAGLPSTMGLLFRAIAAYPLGWLMARVGRRTGLAAGLLVGAFGTAMSALAIGMGTFWVFSLGAGLAGVARGAADLSRYAAAEVSPIDRRAKVIGWIVFAGTIGALTGPLVVEPAVRLAGERGLVPESGPFWVAAIILMVSVLLTFVMLRPDPLTVSRHDEETQRVETGQQADDSARPMEMGMFGLSWLTGWLIDRQGAAAVIIGGSGILVLASLFSPLAGSVTGFSIALFLLGLGWNFCFVAGSALLSTGLAPAERSRVQGFSDTWSSAAAALGSLSTGPLFAAGRMSLVAAVGLAFSLALMAAWLLARRLMTSTGSEQVA